MYLFYIRATLLEILHRIQHKSVYIHTLLDILHTILVCYTRLQRSGSSFFSKEQNKAFAYLMEKILPLLLAKNEDFEVFRYNIT